MASTPDPLTANTPEDMTAPSNPTTESSNSTAPSSNPFLSADDTHDRAISLVLDTSPFLRGGASKLRTLAEKFYTIPEVLNEIRDRQARQDLALLPFDIEVINPTEDSVRAVATFARKTGDLAVLSATDLRVLALTYQLEVAANGTRRIRSEPIKGNTQSGSAKPQQSKRQKNKAKEVADFDDDAEAKEHEVDTQKEEESVVQEGQEGQTESAAGTVLDETYESEDDEVEVVQDSTTATEVAEEKEEAVEELASKLDALSTDEPKAETELEATTTETAEAANEEDDDDGEWITPENVRKFQRFGTSKPKKKQRKPLLMQVACTTGDFAMQNVLLQMGLNLLSIDGLRISKIKSWVLRCHACTAVTHDMERKFCPDCGNATLMRTSTSTDQNGNVKYYLKKNMVYNLRGTKYSIPTPKGGRRNNDLILREDQREYELSMKFQRRQKKIDAFDPDYTPRLLEGQIDSRNPFGAPIIGYGKRNPNAGKKNQTMRRRR
ncbi:Nin1 binding protein [Actinomortierella wolfii]|nr:Nin1 binding protein [Actinomortierella wolfii]